ncbi:transglycosylase domain-containing protein [Sphingobacterium sp. SRCM116780]|uniref:transglycosylase domain-containing protein n=1 Tax=Sphingobacterium sp. SRCM116780 TaxID=2907623 RepID=UPI001F2CF3FF|nr:transglycosylase domain-containing protein [Sphingobacterium sp. SRCM116780]UIR56123.1 transglycosylase domain-containing protein [Sphingobacterium sp. SRCM116780]
MRILYIVLGVLFVFMIAGGVFAYQKRDGMLLSAINKAKEKLASKYDLDLKIQYYSFKGLSSVQFQNIVLQPKGKEQLAHIQDLTVSVRILPLLSGDVKIGQILMDNSAVTLVKKDSTSNYDFLFKKREKDSTKNDKAETNFADLADRMLKSVFFKIPKDMDMNNFEISYQDDSTSQRILIPEAEISGGDLKTKFLLNDHEAVWNLEGTVNPDDKELYLKLFSDKKDVELPLLRRKFGLKASFDAISFRLNKVDRKNKELLSLSGDWGFENLKLNHWRISDKDVIFPGGVMSGALNIGKTSIEIDKESKVKVKEFEFNPYVKYEHKPQQKLELAIHTDRIEAQKFFDAIPVGLFNSLEGIHVSGHMQYDLNFALNFKKPNDVVFSSKMDDKDLKIEKWGNANIQELNTPFTYIAYEKGEPMRTIVLGSQNPDFTPLDQISRYMQISLINTEDPFFFSHNGFQEEAFRLSIATNLKEKKFKRGASTISMQLVKNVFLNRNKTVVRKVEEIILVWLMESSKQVSKKRLYEVYLNVIEWGNNVYGITEASRYYFGKKPLDLTLGESIFLSSIVPRPKTGLYSFDWTGHLKSNMLHYFNTYGHIMVKTGQLGVDSTVSNYGFYQVELLPHLRSARPAHVDTIDSLDFELDEGEEIFPDETEHTKEHTRSIFDKLLGRNKEEEKK